MLNWLRKYSRSWFIALAIGAIVVVFIFWGVGGFRSPRFQEVAVVNGTPILYSAYLRQYNELLRVYQDKAGGELTEENLKALHLKEMALNQMIEEVLILQAAERLGLMVSTSELQDHIRLMPYFQEDGRFSERRYLAMLSRLRLSPTDFEAQEHRRLRMQKLIQMVTAFAKVSEGELQEFFRIGREEVAVNYVVVSWESFASRVHPQENAVAAYYETHRAEFRQPERVGVRYVLFRPEQFHSQVKLNPQEIEAYLSEHRDKLVRPKVIRVRELFLALPPKAKPAERRRVEQQAQSLLAQVRAGQDLEQLVRQYSQNEATRKVGGDLGYIQRGQSFPEWDKVAFSLPLHEVGLAVTHKGYHLLRVEEIKETEKIPEAEAKEAAVQQLREKRSRRLALEAAQQVRGELSDQSFVAVARKAGLAVHETPLFAISDPVPGLGRQRSFNEAAFRLKPQELSGVLEVPQGFAILQCMERQPAVDPPLEQVREKVRQAVVREEAQKLAAQEAQRLLERLRRGEPLSRVAAQAGLPWHDSGLFTRGQGFLGQPGAQELTSAAFQLSKENPYPPQPLQWQDRFYLLAFKERRLPSPEEFRREADKLKEEALKYKRQILLGAWLAKERQQAKIKIYELP